MREAKLMKQAQRSAKAIGHISGHAGASRIRSRLPGVDDLDGAVPLEGLGVGGQTSSVLQKVGCW